MGRFGKEGLARPLTARDGRLPLSPNRTPLAHSPPASTPLLGVGSTGHRRPAPLPNGSGVKRTCLELGRPFDEKGPTH